MRIIAGKYKGRRFSAPKNLPVRPTTDRAKEALFNILSNKIDFENCTVLDLFSGTGNILYEFLSRDIKSAVAIDKDYGCIKYIKQTVKELGEEQKVTILPGNVFQRLPKLAQKFDIIFADPPYNLNNIEDIAALVFKFNLLNPDGILIIEHGKHTNLSHLTHFKEVRNYGNVNFSIFQ
jgi:16S rRNA (guanine(966)-N(2))-methyltransferase RsmD